MRRITIGLLVAANLAACGSSSSSKPRTPPSTSAPGAIGPAVAALDTTHVARSIQVSILHQRNLRSVVVCPPAEPKRAGVRFTCTAIWHRVRVPHTEERTPFAVVVQNDRGYASYIGK